jgi:hypothetical protein
MIIDWLLQEVPQDLLSKLEVYTFGNAANHFNNPHLHLLSQHASLTHPTVPTTTRSLTSVHYHDPLNPLPPPQNGELNGHPRTTRTESSSGKTIRYIEHYAHTSDFVARWGVLHFTCNFDVTDPRSPRFMGRVFERQGQGHQFNQHYLDNMFPLEPVPSSSSPRLPQQNWILRWIMRIKEILFPGKVGKGGVGGSGFLRAKREGNAFMESALVLGHNDEQADEREGVEISYLGAHGEPLGKREKEVLVRDMSPISPHTMRRFGRKVEGEFERARGLGFTNGTNGTSNWEGEKNGVEVGEVIERTEEDVGFGDVEEKKEEGKMEFKVKDLSRLWLYINGGSPKLDGVDVGIARMATI